MSIDIISIQTIELCGRVPGTQYLKSNEYECSYCPESPKQPHRGCAFTSETHRLLAALSLNTEALRAYRNGHRMQALSLRDKAQVILDSMTRCL